LWALVKEGICLDWKLKYGILSFDARTLERKIAKTSILYRQRRVLSSMGHCEKAPLI
jgi:hypothetical protein